MTKHIILNTMNKMPLKDLTSDSAGSFASDRRLYSNLVSIQQPSIEQNVQKKWIGGNRDASNISYRRRIAAVGSSLNPTGGNFSFTSSTEKNTRIEALNRCRNSGNCVPLKVRASNNKTNVPTPIWKKPTSVITKSNLVRTKFHAILTKENPAQINV